MTRLCYCFVTAVFFCCAAPLTAQEKENGHSIMAGTRCPAFTLGDVDYFEKKTVSLDDFKGKWLVLDFWSKTCIVCVKSFPKINALQQRFKKDIRFLLIGNNSWKYNRDIRNVYERFRKKNNRQLSIAYDSVLFKQFGVQVVPHIVIVDPEGVIREITGSAELTEQKLQNIIEGKAFNSMPNDKEATSTPGYAVTAKLFSRRSDSLREPGILFKSVLTRWSRKNSVADFIDYSKGICQLSPVALSNLYNLAYIGKAQWGFDDSLYALWNRLPVLELKEDSLFRPDYTAEKCFYNYSLEVSAEKANRDYMLQLIRSDLSNYFDYEVTMEKRKMPCWNLVATETAGKRLKTKGGPSLADGTYYSGVTLSNMPLTALLAKIWYYHPGEPVLIDQTTIEGNVDINLKAIMTDFKDIQQALQRHGLNLVKSETLLNVLVLRDRQN